jgi:hypothetical protein
MRTFGWFRGAPLAINAVEVAPINSRLVILFSSSATKAGKPILMNYRFSVPWAEVSRQPAASRM